MLRLSFVAAGLLALGVLADWTAAEDKKADAQKPASITKIMLNAHDEDGLRDEIAAEVKKANPDWPAVQKKSKEWVALVSDLPKNDPPKGDKQNWKKLTMSLGDQVKDLDQSAGKKDAKAVMAANLKIGMACKTCHDAHRE